MTGRQRARPAGGHDRCGTPLRQVGGEPGQELYPVDRNGKWGFIDETGQSIQADEILLNIYSPQLVSSQQEYLLALSNLEKLSASSFPDVREGAEELVENALTRLQMLDVPAHQIEGLEKTRKVKKHLHIHSPAAGTVVNVGARRGQYITPRTKEATKANKDDDDRRRRHGRGHSRRQATTRFGD